MCLFMTGFYWESFFLTFIHIFRCWVANTFSKVISLCPTLSIKVHSQYDYTYIIIMTWPVYYYMRLIWLLLLCPSYSSSGYILHLAQSLYLWPGHWEGLGKPGSHLFPSHLQPRETAGGLAVPHLSVRPRQHGAHRVQHPDAAGGRAAPRDVATRQTSSLEVRDQIVTDSYLCHTDTAPGTPKP